MPKHALRVLPWSLFSLFATTVASGQELAFRSDSIGADTAAAISALAAQAIPVYRDSKRDWFLDNLFRLQMVAGRYSDASRTLDSLRALRRDRVSASATAADILYRVLASAKAGSDDSRFADTFRQTYRTTLTRLDDRMSALVIRASNISHFPLDGAVFRAFRPLRGKSSVSLAEALALVRAYQIQQAFRVIVPLAGPLDAEDDRRRYAIDYNLRITSQGGATVCALVIRPRASSRRLPALLNFTIYADSESNVNDARRAASNGYAGVVALTRGKRCSPDAPVPYEYDGVDASAVIDWIARQPWSDGRVGMFGGSYEGFTQWAAAKHLPKALKTIIPAVAVAPGIDVPMDGNLFLSFVYPWPFYTTDNKELDDSTYFDFDRWSKLNRAWYVSGRAYRDLDKIDGKPNPVFDRWIDHPTYDAYWQGMIPYKEEFARVNIPVLQTAGYFFGGPGAAVYYFTQHYKYKPNADSYLVIGPYDHVLGQRGLVDLLGDTSYVMAGYRVDPVALTDFGELRYQWFDWIFKGAPKPSLLKDKVNYQVMGANIWKHAPSIEAMADRHLRFYLSPIRVDSGYRLTPNEYSGATHVEQAVELADRSDGTRVAPGGGVVAHAIDTWNGITYTSAPLPVAMEFSGLFSGRLDFICNKSDFDFQVSLYELTSHGDYILLSTYWTRASAVRDLSNRTLLQPGVRQRLDYQSVRLTSRVLQAGSRLVAMVTIIKQPDFQINYGTGRDVSDETIADAKEPLKISWYGTSFVDLPVRVD
jgi:putative CocE/NonD family hydrolase